MNRFSLSARNLRLLAGHNLRWKRARSKQSQTGGNEMKEYSAVFPKTANGWSSYAPDLPGLGVAAVTFEVTEQFLGEGIELHSERMREDGRRILEPWTQVMRMAISA